MVDIRERFTLSGRTNRSGTPKIFKPLNIQKKDYIVWKVDSNVMLRDVLLANNANLSYPRQLELIHGAIERILKTLIIYKYGLLVPIHENTVIYEALKEDLDRELSEDEYITLRLLDTKFLSDRYPNLNRYYDYDMVEDGINLLVTLNDIVSDGLTLSNRARLKIDDLEDRLVIALDRLEHRR